MSEATTDCHACADNRSARAAADKDAARWRLTAITAMRRHCNDVRSHALRKNSKRQLVPCRSMLEVATLLYPYHAAVLYPDENVTKEGNQT